MKDEISRQQLRVVQYDYVDGTPDLAFGGLCLLMTICFTIFAAFPDLSSSTFSAIISWMVFGAGGFLIGWLPQRVKERVTYPRTGFIAYRRQGHPLNTWVRWTIRIGIPLLVILLLVLMFLNCQKIPAESQYYAVDPNPGLVGLMFGSIWAFIGWKVVCSRYYLIAVITLLISIALLFSGSSGNFGLAVLSGSMSLVLFASGGITLWRYLHQNPAPREEAK